jgi:hypothetical protein
MSPSDPNRPWQPRKHEDPERILNPFERPADPEAAIEEHSEQEELDPLEDDPSDPAETSDPETVAKSNPGR